MRQESPEFPDFGTQWSIVYELEAARMHLVIERAYGRRATIRPDDRRGALMFRRHPALAAIGGIALTLGAAVLLGLLLAYGVQPWVASGTWGANAQPRRSRQSLVCGSV